MEATPAPPPQAYNPTCCPCNPSQVETWVYNTDNHTNMVVDMHEHYTLPHLREAIKIKYGKETEVLQLKKVSSASKTPPHALELWHARDPRALGRGGAPPAIETRAPTATQAMEEEEEVEEDTHMDDEAPPQAPGPAQARLPNINKEDFIGTGKWSGAKTKNTKIPGLEDKLEDIRKLRDAQKHKQAAPLALTAMAIMCERSGIRIDGMNPTDSPEAQANLLNTFIAALKVCWAFNATPSNERLDHSHLQSAHEMTYILNNEAPDTVIVHVSGIPDKMTAEVLADALNYWMKTDNPKSPTIVADDILIVKGPPKGTANNDVAHRQTATVCMPVTMALVSTLFGKSTLMLDRHELTITLEGGPGTAVRIRPERATAAKSNTPNPNDGLDCMLIWTWLTACGCTRHEILVMIMAMAHSQGLGLISLQTDKTQKITPSSPSYSVSPAQPPRGAKGTLATPEEASSAPQKMTFSIILLAELAISAATSRRDLNTATKVTALLNKNYDLLSKISTSVDVDKWREPATTPKAEAFKAEHQDRTVRISDLPPGMTSAMDSSLKLRDRTPPNVRNACIKNELTRAGYDVETVRAMLDSGSQVHTILITMSDTLGRGSTNAHALVSHLRNGTTKLPFLTDPNKRIRFTLTVHVMNTDPTMWEMRDKAPTLGLYDRGGRNSRGGGRGGLSLTPPKAMTRTDTALSTPSYSEVAKNEPQSESGALMAMMREMMTFNKGVGDTMIGLKSSIDAQGDTIATLSGQQDALARTVAANAANAHQQNLANAAQIKATADAQALANARAEVDRAQMQQDRKLADDTRAMMQQMWHEHNKANQAKEGGAAGGPPHTQSPPRKQANNKKDGHG